MVYDGIIFREIEEISTIVTTSATFTAAGAAGISVEPCMLCGVGAFGVAWGQEPAPKTDTTADYQFRPGVAIEELRGIAKLGFATGAAGVTKQNGMVTLYVSGVGD